MSGRLRHTLPQSPASLELVKQESLAEQYPQNRIGRHPYGWPHVIDFRAHPSTRGPVVIGNDVWIGYRAISRRFPTEVIARLGRVAWWSWPDDEIAEAKAS